MIALPAGVKVWLAAGATDLRNGFDGLAALVHAYSAEVDRLFRRNVTGDSAESAL